MTNMEKTFVLDANVLLHDPQSIHSFQDNKVVIIISVLAEVDTFKKNPGQLGANSREVARELEKISKNGNFSSGIPIENGGMLFVYPYNKGSLKINCDQSVDNNLLCEAAHLRSVGENAVIVSKDIILRVMANGLGIPAEDYETDRKNVEDYSGVSEIQLSDEDIDLFVQGPSFKPEGYVGYPNQYVHITSVSDPKKSLLGKTLKDGSIAMLRSNGIHALNIRHKNMEQIFAMDALFDDNIKIVTLQGRSGTGKTLIAIAAGIAQLLDDKFARLSVTRPVIPIGNDIGFIPGSLTEKFQPWMQPINDAIDFIREIDRKSNKSTLSTKFTDDLIQIAPLMHMRGRSIPHSFMVIDESQNIMAKEVKTIVTRSGEGTKLVFTGDIEQIDNPFLDIKSNGLSYLISKFKTYDIHAHVNLRKGERSQLAEIGANIL